MVALRGGPSNENRNLPFGIEMFPVHLYRLRLVNNLYVSWNSAVSMNVLLQLHSATISPLFNYSKTRF